MLQSLVGFTSVALFKFTSPAVQVRSAMLGKNGLQRIGTNGPDWLKYIGTKLAAKFMFETLVMTSLIKLTSWAVTSLLRNKVSWVVALSTQGSILSNAVCAVGFWTHSFIATQVSAATLVFQREEKVSFLVVSHADISKQKSIITKS